MTDKQIHVTVIPEQERINVVFGHGVHETQADWNQQDSAASDYIKNKPPETTAGEGITITDGVVSIDTESEVWAGKQDVLTFGDGLDLNDGELSVDVSEVISAGDGVTISNGEISIDTSDAQDGEILFAIAEEVNSETKLVVHWGIPPTGNYVDLANLPKINGVTLVGNKSTADLLIPVYTDMIGATASTAGTSGLVPAPVAGDNTRFLRGDGSWQDVPHQDTTYTAGANINIDANNNNAISVSSGNAANTQFLKSDGNGGAVWTGALVRSVNNRTGDLIMYPQMGSGANALFFSPQMSASDASGDYSEAHGYQTKSAGSGSVTFGYKTKTGANAAYAEAHGSQTTASGNYSAAFGGGTTASGANSFAIGEDTIASGTDSFAIGYRTRATGNRSIAGGNQTEAGHSSIAIGDGMTATGDCSAGFGIYTGASGNYSLVSGIHSTASGTASVALGHTATASNTGAVALGRSTQATGQNSFAAGDGGVASALGSVALSGGSATSNYAVAIGKGANATAANSFAIGHTITANQDYSTIVGYYGKTPTNALFSVANGVHDYATAFNVFKNGDIAAGSNWTPTADNHLATKKYVDDNAGGGVQSDWDVTDNTSPAFIKNKPTIPTVPVTDVQVNGLSVVSGGVASVMSSSTETIEVADWNGGTTATISVAGVTASNIVMVAPSPSDYSDYASANIRCTAQASGQLTFTCDTTPSSDIDVNIVIWG